MDDQPAPDPWTVEIVVVTRGSHTSAERKALSRDCERGRRARVGPGRYAMRADLEAMTPEGRHLVAMRALAASSRGPVVFSHWSAAVAHGLPALRPRLQRPHITTDDDALRHRTGVLGHRFQLDGDEVVERGGLLVTAVSRTVVDVAGAGAFEEGVMAADAALMRGLPRAVLEAAIDLAGPRQASAAIARAVAFGHPGGESPAESLGRVSALRLGVEVPDLQHRLVLPDGSEIFLDQRYPQVDAALEIDGDVKYRDRRMAPDGPGAAVLVEKRREDQARTLVRSLGRVGWREARDPVLLRPVLGRIGVRPLASPPPFEAWCAAAALARPRRAVRRSAAV